MFDIFSDPTLHEEDPMTTDWEGCKPAINNGKIATMVMGSWAVSQFQEAGDNADDIGYMPAPFSTSGKQYAESAPDYCMALTRIAPMRSRNSARSTLHGSLRTAASLRRKAPSAH